MNRMILTHTILCLLALLLICGSAWAQGLPAFAGKALPLRRAPEITALVDAKTPGYLTIRAPSQTVPGKTMAVDFDKEMLLAAVMGANLTGDGSTGIKITGVREFADRIGVTVIKNNFVNGDYEKNALVCMLDVVVVPKKEKPVYFTVSEYTGDKFTGTTTIYPVLNSFTGPRSKIDKATTMVITDAAAWQKLWTDSIGDTPPKADINFTRQVVAIFSGKGGDGFAPLVVSSDGKHLLISYRHDRAIDMEQLFIPTPYQIAIIPASALPVVFLDVTPTEHDSVTEEK